MELLERIGWHGKREVIGLSLRRSIEGIYMARLRQRKGQLELMETCFLENWETCLQKLNQWPGLPISLYFEPAVLLEDSLSVDENNVPTQLLGMNPSDPEVFMYQAQRNDSDEQWISMTRRDEWESIKTQLGSHHARLVNLQYSLAFLSSLIPLVGNYQSDLHYELKLGETTYYWQKRLVGTASDTAITLTQEDLAHSLDLDLNYLIAYAAAIVPFLNLKQESELENQFARTQKGFQRNQIIIRSLVLGSLVSILLCLSAFGLEQYHAFSTRGYQTIIAEGQGLLREVQQNQTQLSRKTRFLSQHKQGNVRISQKAAHLDQMMAAIPAEIQLKQWTLNPEPKWLKKKDPSLPSMKPDLLIEGEAIRSAALPDLTQKLGQLDFIDRLNYWEVAYDFENQWQAFTLLIWLKNE